MRYVTHTPKMWCSGKSISERSPGFIGRQAPAHSQKVSSALTVSSAPRGVEVVPDVKTIIEV